MFLCLKYNILLVPFILFYFELLLYLLIHAVILFIILANYKYFLDIRYAFSTGYMAVALFSKTEWCSRNF